MLDTFQQTKCFRTLDFPMTDEMSKQFWKLFYANINVRYDKAP